MTHKHRDFVVALAPDCLRQQAAFEVLSQPLKIGTICIYNFKTLKYKIKRQNMEHHFYKGSGVENSLS